MKSKNPRDKLKKGVQSRGHNFPVLVKNHKNKNTALKGENNF